MEAAPWNDSLRNERGHAEGAGASLRSVMVKNKSEHAEVFDFVCACNDLFDIVFPWTTTPGGLSSVCCGSAKMAYVMLA